MTPMERKKLQYQLDALKARKAKADTLGPDVIARTQAKYDGICAEIRSIQDQLDADAKTVTRALADAAEVIANMHWPEEGTVERIQAKHPQLYQKVQAAADALCAAEHRKQYDALPLLIDAYLTAFRQINAAVNAPPAQTSLLGFEEVTDDADNPFTRRAAGA